MAGKDTSIDYIASHAWEISPNASMIDLIDEVQKNFSQLAAMVSSIYGEGFESFRDSSDAIQDAYIWAIAEKISFTRAAFDRLEQLRTAGGD